MWHSPGFEARVDCIWDGYDPPVNQAEAEENNRLAAAFIHSKSDVHHAFLLTLTPLTEWQSARDPVIIKIP